MKPAAWKQKLFYLGILAIFPFSFYGQNADFGNWFQYFGNRQFNQKWNWHNEVQYRNYNFIGDLEQLLLRTGIGYNLSKNNNNLLLGYGFILSENYVVEDVKEQVNEHRIFQQFINRHVIGVVYFQHRLRFEQRWIEKRDVELRFRYFLGINIPLNAKEMASGTYYFSAYNELFLNLQGDVFDRNRLYGALGYQVSVGLRFELGYMNQFLPNGGRDQLNMAAFYTF
jgi:hypothetical protein